jgi:hypothetical protein
VKPAHAARNILIGVRVAIIAIGAAVGIALRFNGLG